MLYSAKSWAALCSFYALKDTECKMMTIIKGTGVCTQCSFQEQRTSGSPSLLSRPSGGKFLEGREAAVVGFYTLGSVCVGWTSHKQRVLIVLQEMAQRAVQLLHGQLNARISGCSFSYSTTNTISLSLLSTAGSGALHAHHTLTPLWPVAACSRSRRVLSSETPLAPMSRCFLYDDDL